MSSLKLGVAFSGGGVRAASQIGIMKALYEAGIRPEVFVGTSGGSIVATLLALGYEPDKAFEFFKQTHDVFDIAIIHIIKGLITNSDIEGLVKGNKLESILEELFDYQWVSQLEYDWAAVATDIKTGREIIYSNMDYSDFDHNKINNDSFHLISTGSLSEIVRASCSFPGVFIPKRLNGYTLVDGGLTNNLPSDVAKALGADRVISITLGQDVNAYNTNGIISILNRSFDIIFDRSGDNNDKDHDILINPGVADIGVFALTEIDDCFKRGYEYGKYIAESIIMSLDNETEFQ
jgi:NTE family protein